MLEEKNDNLSVQLNETDGNLENESQEVIQPEVEEVEEVPTEPIAELEIEVAEVVIEDVATETSDAITAIENENAAENEDETLKERHEIPMLDYESLSMEEIIDELEKLNAIENIMSVKDHVEEIKNSFLAKYYHFLEEKKEEFNAGNPESKEEFHYQFPLKSKFDQLYSSYRDKKNAHFKNLQNNLKNNLEVRLTIVEELKELINPQENIKDTLKHFNELRERWKNAGAIPKDKYNHVWNNYHFHVENFYDYLHLDREARDLDFKHNLDQKLKIISRVEHISKI